MDGAVNVMALTEELGVRRELLYLWRRKFRTGGADALQPMGRPRNGACAFEAVPAAASAEAIGADQRRIEELERKIGQQMELDFFRAAPAFARARLLRHVGEARRTTGVPGETASTR